MKVESCKTHIQKERNLADCQVSFLWLYEKNY